MTRQSLLIPRSLSSTLRSFFDWWRGELSALVPQRWRSGLFDLTPPLSLRFDGEGAILDQPDGAPEAKHSGRPVWIFMPRASGLRRTFSLPLRAEGDLSAAVEFEIDRQTPFTSGQVWHGARVAKRDPGRGLLWVELCAIPLSRAQKALALAESWGLSATGMSVEGGPAINLLPRSLRRYRSWRAEPWKLIAGLNLLVLVAGLAGTGLYHAVSADRLERAVAQRSDVAQRADDLKQRLDSAKREAGFLAAKRVAPRPVEILAELSRVLPDQAWLYDVTLSEGSLRIAGYATSVPDVLDQIAKAKLFGDPRLAAPVVHGGNVDKDRFEVILTVRERAP
jgi:general secretion pathway protein L